MTPNSPKVVLIAGDHSGSNAARRQSDQDIERHFPEFVDVIMLTLPDAAQQLAGLYPMRLSRRDDPATVYQLSDKSKLDARSCAAQKLVNHDGRTPNDVGRVEQLKREAPGTEILDIDGGVQNGELSRP
jgi:hypothetical protein